MDVRLSLDPICGLPGYVEGDCFVTWHARYQKSVAYHEAGHAVAFVVADQTKFGVEHASNLRSLVFVEAQGAMGGGTGLARAFMDYSHVVGSAHRGIKHIDHEHPLAPSLVAAMEHDIFGYLAGPYAQVVFEQGPQPSGALRASARRIEEAQSDFVMGVRLHLEVSRIRRRRRRFSDMEERAYTIVMKCWPAIADLASTLLDERFLEGTDVYKIVTPKLAKCGLQTPRCGSWQR